MSIVDETADLKASCRKICFGKFTNGGQTCTSPDFIFVHESVKDEFVNVCLYTMKKFFGSIDESSEYLAKMITEDMAKKMKTMIDEFDPLSEDSNVQIIGGNVDISNRFV